MKILRGHRRTDGLLADYCDGSDYANHPLFSKDMRSLQIIPYYDEVEVCNPLGIKEKTHKLGRLFSIEDYKICFSLNRNILLYSRKPLTPLKILSTICTIDNSC